MEKIGMNDVFTKRDMNSVLCDKYKNISICLSLASGYVWKSRVYSCSRFIAQELLDFFDSDDSGDNYSVLIDNFYRMNLEDNKLYFRKNNVFGAEKLNKDLFLNQKLVFFENHKIPLFLFEDEKERMQSLLSTDESIVLNKAYNRQELNGNKYYLDHVYNEFELQKILTKTGYYDVTIGNYLQMVAKGNFELRVNNKLLQDTYNNYILELGSYVAKKIKVKIS